MTGMSICLASRVNSVDRRRSRGRSPDVYSLTIRAVLIALKTRRPGRRNAPAFRTAQALTQEGEIRASSETRYPQCSQPTTAKIRRIHAFRVYVMPTREFISDGSGRHCSVHCESQIAQPRSTGPLMGHSRQKDDECVCRFAALMAAFRVSSRRRSCHLPASNIHTARP